MTFKIAIANCLFLALVFLNLSCKSQDPELNSELLKYPVTGGFHQPNYLGTTEAPYGYYFFTPQSSLKSTKKYPLLIFLHGAGERGNSQTNSAELEKILRNGPCKMIDKETWNPSVEMFVASPQCHGSWWDREMLKTFIEYLLKQNDQIDQSRIYLTGLSMGGFATFDLIGAYGNSLPVAAAVAICGSGVINETHTLNLSKIPLWVFHGSADGVVSPDYSKAIVPAINALNPKVKAKLTIFSGVGHDSWTMTYEGSGMGKEDPAYDVFNQDIYSWLNQFKR